MSSVSLIGRELTEIPFTELLSVPTVRDLDASWNSLPHLGVLLPRTTPTSTAATSSAAVCDCATSTGICARLANVQTLVLDNCEIGEWPSSLPGRADGCNAYSSVRTLSLNNNNIESVDDLFTDLDRLGVDPQRLEFLSLLKNHCCPNALVGKESDDYRRYRYYVLHRLPQLRFLDSTKVTADERAEAARVGQFLRVARPDKEAQLPPNATPPAAGSELPPGVRGLDELDDTPGQQARAPRAAYGYSSYVYYGSQSQGNRFIRNDEFDATSTNSCRLSSPPYFLFLFHHQPRATSSRVTRRGGTSGPRTRASTVYNPLRGRPA
eukprot:CAMPEP_0170736240 /NCGR_PEP_ID=MMETSP0437-20130122/3512_1 /TAXON_ID=0 /ORGANISM="Sexangularia sp." /LENGTH=322 /DNA_ID=CAMNT_0011074595 /DNA_START=65 /DNA_END=1031 /DNA_ORIENTATION=-